MFGFDGAELIGRNVGVLMPENQPCDHDSHGAAHVDNGFRTIIGRRRTVEGQRRNGEIFPLELTVSEAQVADGPVFFGVMRDLSPIEAERRRVNVLRDELAHVSRLNDMGEMVAGLAHEVAQPVAAILNFSAAYRRALATTGKAPEADLIGKIEDQARRAAEILKRLRGFIEKRPPERRAVGIESLIDDALKLLTLRSRPRLLRPPSPDELAGARICVDPIQIEQVLVNLLRNADDALIDTAAPEIVIETRLAAPGRLKVNVGDNGAGVDAEAVAELFDPFFTTKHFGMGMGLSISRGIVESHGGSIGYRPNAPLRLDFRIRAANLYRGRRGRLRTAGLVRRSGLPGEFRQQADDLGIVELVKLAVELAHAIKVGGRGETDDLIDEAAQPAQGVRGGDRNRQDQFVGPPPLQRADRGLHACSGGDPVIDDDGRAAACGMQPAGRQDRRRGGARFRRIRARRAAGFPARRFPARRRFRD